MRVIDTHHHFLPPRYVDRVGEDAIAGLLVSGKIPQWSAEQSIEAMDRASVELAVLSLSSPGLCTLAPDERAALARHCNEYAARLMQDHPRRFGSFATLPLPDVDASLGEIDHCLGDLSCDGFCLLTNYAGRYLGEADFTPVLEELNRRSAIVFVHPAMPEPQAASLGLPAASLEFPFDTTRTIAGMLFNGTFARYRNIRFLFSHAGGTIPFLAARLARLESQERFKRNVPDGVIAELKRLYFDVALSVDSYTLPGLLRFAAADHVVFGSDYPHAGPVIIDNALKSLGAHEVGPDTLAAITRANAIGLLGARG
ncbi:amidohydrolase [Bradyrhizobium lablabi]|uniref:amidohydrolase family protein n=1 Tax=Bradyrhizobium lablabi TaxID=722472 RepID=UPI001BAC13DD|nr:amidohydrolase family protein [Bradyrhizobium lablabi]MBR1119963.1 amidohydrolase [Bradyrhizobium lablabi]